MEQRGPRNVLFLCTGNYYRSRFAEILFNSVASGMGLPWKATSRALALERGAGNVGPMAPAAVENLQTRGVRAAADFARVPVQATPDDFARAHWIVALKQTEHVPLLQERFPTWTEHVEFWAVDDDAGALAMIEAEVLDLTARLIRGGKPREAIAPPPVPVSPKPIGPTKNAAVVRVARETKGRRGKGVTIVNDVPLDEAGLQELAARLKQRCGTGGTVKDGRIEIQGDQRDRLVAELEALGYRVKRAGG
jgi:predicted translation initiation factor SUI1